MYCRSRLFLICLNLLLSLLLPHRGNAQNVNVGNGALPPLPGVGHSYVTHLAETVNPANGTLSVSLPLPVAPSRGITFPVTLNYNSGQTHQFYSYIASEQALQPVDGWSLTAPTLSWSSWMIPYPPYGQQTCQYWSGFVFTDPTGQPHALNLALVTTISAGAGACLHFMQKDQPGPGAYSGNPSSITVSFNAQTQTHDEGYFAVDLNTCDGSNATAPCNNPPNIKVVGPDGTVYNFNQPSPIPGENASVNGTMLPRGQNTAGGAPNNLWLPSSIVDRNGNTVRYSVSYTGGGGAASVTATDSMGRTFLNANPNASSVIASGSLYAINPGAVSVNYTLPNHTVSIAAGYHCGALFNDNSAKSIIRTVTLPNHQSYTFSYDSQFGLLNEIHYPTGAWTKYTWKMPAGTYTDTLYVDGENNNNGPPYKNACAFQYGTPVIDTRSVGQGDDSAAATAELVQTFSYVTNWDTSNPAIWDTKQTIMTTVDHKQGTSYTTTYLYNGLQAGQVINANSYVAGQVPTEASTSIVNANGIELSREIETWNSSFGPSSTTTYKDGQFVQKITHPTYTYFGVPTSTVEYDRDLTTVLRKSVTNLLAQQLAFPCQEQTFDGQGNVVSETDTYYDGSSTICGTGSGGVHAVSGLNPSTYTSPDPNASRGNATQVTRVNPRGTPATTTASYDETGQVISSTDGCGNATCGDVSGSSHTTTYSYADSPSSGANNSNAYLTQLTDPLGHLQKFSYNYTTGQLASATDANGRTTGYVYNDSLNRLTETDYPDGGAKKIQYADGSTGSSITTTTVASPDPNVVSVSVMDGMGRVTQTQLTSDPAGTDYVDTVYNGVGEAASVSNPHRGGSLATDGITQYTYDALGRKTSETEPDSSKKFWCYDGVASTGQPNCLANASSQTNTSWVDTSDEAGKHWQHATNALGQLVAVMEPSPGTGKLALETDYSYDLLNNLLGVTQKGVSGEQARTRSFTYDSLSRLLTSSNPETGTVCYGQWSGSACQGGYDANGNLQYKTDAKNTVTSYTYDVLNRLSAKHYSDGSLPQSYGYDGRDTNGNTIAQLNGTSSIGRVSNSSNNANSASFFEYDIMGRLIAKEDCNPHNCGYNDLQKIGYDLAGNMTNMQYPDTRAIQQTFDGAGHLATVTDVTPNIPGATYYTAGTFWPSGQVHTATLGNGVTLDTELNSRLQPVGMSANSPAVASVSGHSNVYDKTVGYVSANNGNIQSITDNLNPNQTQSFAYDRLNRLSTAMRNDGAYNHIYRYDSFGNMLLNDQVQPQPSGYCINAGTNQLLLTSNPNCQGGSSLGYDANGRLQADPVRQYTYDAEGEITGIGGSTTATYAYNEGQRTGKTTSAGWTDYIYLNGQPVAEQYSDGTETDYIYANGQKIAKATNTAYFPASTDFYVADQVGSTQAELSGTGTILWQGAFTPFGQEILNGGTSNAFLPQNDGASTHYKFTDKERDQESGLDYFGARYYGSTMGRFSSPDYSDDPDPLPFVDPGRPQTLNLYTYGTNNPLSNVDSTGHDVNVCTNNGNGGQHCSLISNEEYQQGQKGSNGGLNVPSLNSVGMTGSGSITDPSGNTVGTATYVSNGGFDFYGNQAGFNQLAMTGATVGSLKGVATFYGASATGALGAYFEGLTALGGIEANSILGANGQRSLMQILSQVTDKGLRNVVTNLYRATATIGDGGTADAISYTKETGELVGGSDHIIKGEQSVRALERVINSGRLTEAEKGIAQYLQNALKSALK